ncbi:MAG: type I DNA topoisomerase [Verrucomicrobiota bacterium]
MGKNLVIVESPAKAKTINKILGQDFVVKASMGHVRDLPEKDFGIDLEHGFKPKYVTIKAREKVLKELRAEAQKAERIYLAPDPDREGEAIAWHLKAVLGKGKAEGDFFRVSYNEITAPAIRKAFAEPGRIDLKKVDSQQARRVLDRVVGYKVSPLLWRRIRGAASAGRVQSVALRLVCERERDISNFTPQEYWVLGAKVCKQVDPRDPFTIKLARVNGEKADVKTAEQAHATRQDLEGRVLRVSAILTREISKRPYPPYITSSLQQAASSLFGFAPAYTMKLAQKLYEGEDFGEGPVGLITYMRTDSFSVSREAQESCLAFVQRTYGAEFLPGTPNVYRSRSGAQEAHEAIRPTDVNRLPEHLSSVLDPDEIKLYRIIWQRFVASQMAPARIHQRTAEVQAEPAPGKTSTYLFRATASDVVFPGYMRVTGAEERDKEKNGENGDETDRLPPLTEGEVLDCLEWLEQQKFTQPPPRYSEASLVRALEENGVGRPSTYAQILSTLVQRKYVLKEKRMLKPTEVGLKVNDFLVTHLGELFDVKFTAEMEKSLDEIENGSVEWVTMMDRFYKDFTGWMEKAKGPPADPGMVKRLLDVLNGVREWGPEVKRGKRTYSDQKFAQSIRKQLEEGKPISERQGIALKKLLCRYKEQLPEFDRVGAELGITRELEVLCAPPEPPRPETIRKLELLKPLQFREARQVGKKVFDDRVFVESLRRQVESGRALSPNQVHYLDRVFVRYQDQIPDFEAVAKELGVGDASIGPDLESGPLLEALKAVKEWNPATSRRGRVWDDHKFYESLSRQFGQHRRLSPKQVASLKRMVRRYAAQVPGYEGLAERYGIAAPTKGRSAPKDEAAPA